MSFGTKDNLHGMRTVPRPGHSPPNKVRCRGHQATEGGWAAATFPGAHVQKRDQDKALEYLHSPPRHRKKKGPSVFPLLCLYKALHFINSSLWVFPKCLCVAFSKSLCKTLWGLSPTDTKSEINQVSQCARRHAEGAQGLPWSVRPCLSAVPPTAQNCHLPSLLLHQRRQEGEAGGS